ncbi:uncharacterized protein O3C94_016851 [Discoglossus pictus]
MTYSTVSKTEQEQRSIRSHQPVKEEESPINISEGLYHETLYTESINDKGEYEREQKDIQKLETYPHQSAVGPSIVRSQTTSKLEQDDLNIRDHQPVKEEEICIDISEAGLYDNNLDTVSVMKEEKDELDQRDILQVTIHSDLCADASMDMNAPGQSHNSDKDITNIYQGTIHVNTPSENGSNSEMINVAKGLTCTDCGKHFNNRYYLIGHQKIHLGEKPFACSQCGKCFCQKSDLIIHQRIHTGEKPFTCSQCGKCFREKAQLVKHQRIHTGEKPFACSQCGKCFTQKTQLVTHQRIHTGEKPYPCTQCGKCFSEKSKLVKHQRIHTGEKPFACAECGKCFCQRTDLVRHERIHTGEKPYACSHCGKCFTQKSQLDVHQRVHVVDKPSVFP